jgi:hypothetical protein
VWVELDLTNATPLHPKKRNWNHFLEIIQMKKLGPFGLKRRWRWEVY